MARAHIAVLAAASLALSTGARADASPFAGTWKLNAEKSRGTWRSTDVAVTCFTTIDVAGFTTVDIAPFENGLTLTLVEPSARASITIDGTDHPLEGPRTPPGMSLSLRPHGERTLAIVEKQDLIPIYVGTLSVSDDRRTLTWTWKPALVDEPISAVFDRL